MNRTKKAKSKGSKGQEMKEREGRTKGVAKDQ